jgi:hypothetical protein
MMERRLYRFAYAMNGRRDRPTHFSQTRDPEAGMWLCSRLIAMGYTYRGVLLNYPALDGTGPDVDLTQFGPDDLIYITTRPPADDEKHEERRGSKRSRTNLEEALFEGPIRKHFEDLARSQVALTPSTAGISEEIGKRRFIVFRQHGGAAYEAYGPGASTWTRFKKSDRSTAAFLLYAEHAWEGGPAFLAAFGMGGTETLVWCYLLATRPRLANLLCTTSFAMAELDTNGWPQRPQSLAFADPAAVNLLGVAPEPAARSDRVRRIDSAPSRRIEVRRRCSRGSSAK